MILLRFGCQQVDHFLGRAQHHLAEDEDLNPMLGIDVADGHQGQGTHGWAFQERKHRGTIEDDGERGKKTMFDHQVTALRTGNGAGAEIKNARTEEACLARWSVN